VIVEALLVPLWADLLAIAVCSLQSALLVAAYRDRRLDLLGVAVIGIAAGLGGGLLRDVFLGVTPVAFTTNWYLAVATLAALVGMALGHVFRRVDWAITGLDALAIGLFAAIGTTKALTLGVAELPAIFLGVITAVGGGIVREILLGLPIGIMHVGPIYAIPAAVGSVSLLLLALAGAPIAAAATICVLVTAVIRVLAVRFGWSLPEQRALRLRLRRQQRDAS